MAEHYEYGHLPAAPDHLNASLTGNTLKIDIDVNGTKASLNVVVNMPSNHTKPHPVLIVGSFLRYSFAKDGFAVINIDLPKIAGDNKNRTGVFYTLYPNADTGVLMAWAWSYHRVIDALKAMPELNAKQIAVTGHSRYGKAALIAGAFDERVAITYPMSSGLSGVGNYRFFYEEHGKAEKISNAYGTFPWWYTPLFEQFVPDVNRLPFDQHSIIALVAPRALLITEGNADYWSNPQGTSVSYRAAKIVYQYLGVGDRIGIAYREGAHMPTNDDFSAIVQFADKYYNNVHYNRTFDSIPYPIDKFAIPWSSP